MGAARASIVFVRRAALGLVCAVIVLAALVLGTAPGARLTLRLLDELVPSELSAGAIGGSWLGGVVLHDVRYVDDSARAEIGRLELAPNLPALLRGRLELRHLDVDGGRVTLAAGDPRSDAAGPPNLPAISSRIAVTDIRATNVRVTAAGATVQVDRVAGALTGHELRIDALELAVADVGVSGSGLATAAADGTQAWLEGRLQARSLDSAWRVDAVARATIDAATEPWTVSFEWDRLAWQGAALGELVSPAGRLVLTPGAEPAAATLTAQIGGTRLPEAVDVAAAAAYDGRTVDVVALGVAGLGGELRGTGAVDVADRAGTLHLAARALDPAHLDGRLGGSVDGDLEVELGAAPTLQIGATGSLGGQLDGRVQATGTIGPAAVQLEFSADLPDAGAWYPPASGAITATGEARGPPHDPTVHAEIEARELALAGAAPRLDTVALVLDGSMAAHAIDVRATSASSVLHAQIEQAWDGRALSGTVRGSTLAIARAGTWTLDVPAGYVVGPADSEAGPLCYTGPRASKLCAALRDRQLTATAARVPSQLAAPWLPRGVQLAGTADAELAFDWRSSPRGTFSLDQPALEVELAGDAAETGASGTFEITDLVLRGALDEARFEASLAASLGGAADRIDGALELQPPTADGALTGRLTAELTNLAALEAFVGPVEGLRGRIALDVGVDGSPAEPRVAAELQVDSLRAAVPQLGADVTDGTLVARADSYDAPLIEFDGQLCMDGCATFTGQAMRQTEQPWSVAATLVGEPMAVVGLPQLRAAVAPDLALAADGGLWRLTGSLDVADAALTVVELPRAAVRPAPETVVHGRETDARKVERVPASLMLDLQARLGDVRFEGAGVAAELDGALNLQRRANGPLLVQGTTSVESGSFRAYGQELAIERGLLIFTGAFDDPTLDIRATRAVEGTQVGLSISGTASNPRSEVFSDAALSDSEAFSRLVTGRSLKSAGSADVETLERAALGLGLSRVLPSLDRLGATLGLSELGFDSGNADTDGGLLVAGRQLGDDVLLRYKHGLFDDFASIELIYRITENLRLHTESGTAQSIDVIYEVDPAAVVPALRDLARRPSTEAEPPDAEP